MKIGKFNINMEQSTPEEKEIKKQYKTEKRKIRFKYRLIGIGICLVVVVILAGLGVIGDSKSKTDKLGLRSNQGYTDAVKNGVDKDNSREIGVHNKNFLESVQKGNVLDSSYTFEEVFDDYFVSTKWRAFHDTESDVDVAEFTGKCTYANKDADAVIQMIVDNGHVYFPYMSVNNVEISHDEINSFLHDALNTYIQDNVHG